MKNLFLGNPLFFMVSVIVFLGFLGPFLISAQSTIAVLLGVAALVLLIYWLYHLAKFHIAKFENTN